MPAVKVLITGGAGNIGGYLAFAIAKGAMLGPNQPIELRLLEIPAAAKALEGVIMELNDGNFPLVTKIVGTTDYKEAFSDIDIAMLIGAKPRSPGMLRADLLAANAAIFKGQGQALNRYASRNVKVVVVGNPANTNCLIAQQNAPDLSPSCFSALTRLDLNRATGMIAAKCGVLVKQVRNIVIWGNHSATQYPDISQAVLTDYPRPGLTCPVRSCVNDDAWLFKDFIKDVQKRGAAVLKARGKSSAASAANAAVDHMRDWWLGTAPGQIVSMAIPSDGSYGVPKGLVFSFPVTIANKQPAIVRGFSISQMSRKLIDATAEELLAEKAAALGTPSRM